MSYLDYKERVIDLKLTSYGKYLLSQGKLNPVYYAFFDEDVIYDSRYANVSESQSAIEPRIQEDTPRFSTQTVFSGREVEIFNKNPNIYNDLIVGSDIDDKEKIAQGLIKIQDEPEHCEVLQEPLGTSDTANNFAPAWNALFYKAPLSSSTEYLEISSSRGIVYKNIPQLNVDLQYTVYRLGPNSTMVNPDMGLGNEGFGSSPGDVSSESIIEFEDGSVISIGKDALILRLEESNTFFQKENFEIECFEIKTVNGKENLIPLRHYKDQMELDFDFNQREFAPGTIEQYFEIDVDGDINADLMCPFIKKDKTKSFFETKIFNCEDLFAEDTRDIYKDIDDTEEICE